MNEFYRSDRKLELSAVFGLCIEFAAAICLFILGLWIKSTTVIANAVYCCAGLVVWAMGYLHLRQLRLAAEEEDDASGSSAVRQGIFEEDKTGILSAQDKLRQMEKWFLTSASAVLAASMIVAGYFLFRKNLYFTALDLSKQNIAVIVLISTAFVTFLSARFGAGLASAAESASVLKYPAGMLAGVSVLSFLLAVSVILNYFGYSAVYRFTGYFIPIWICVAGADMGIHIVLDFYRPRVKGKLQKPPYQSFLAGILAQPQNLFSAAANSLDYQFGFKISQTWFYRFIEKIIAPLVLFQMLVLYSLTSVVIVKPYVCAVLEKFGSPDRKTGLLGPGIHLKLPWPFQKIKIVPRTRIQSVFINPPDEKEDVILWCVEHHEDPKMILLPSKSDGESYADNETAGGIAVNLLSVSAEVQYKVKEPFNYLYNLKNPGQLVYNIGLRELMKVSSSMDIFDFLGDNRMSLNRILKDNIQVQLDTLDTGIEVVFAGIYELHPPAQVAQSFGAVVESIEDKQTGIITAQIYKDKLVPKAQSDRKSIISQAQSYTLRKKLISESESLEFKNQLAAYNASPEIYRWRKYLSTLKKAVAGTRKIIISSELDSGETTVLDLMEKTQQGLMDITITGKEDNSK